MTASLAITIIIVICVGLYILTDKLYFKPQEKRNAKEAAENPRIQSPLCYSILHLTLHVSEKATQEEIKAAYRKLVFKYHPDKNNNSNESQQNFLKIQHAYEILSKPELRAKYDAELEIKRQQKFSAYLSSFLENSGKSEAKQKELKAEKRLFFIVIIPLCMLVTGVIINYFSLDNVKPSNIQEIVTNTSETPQHNVTNYKPSTSPYKNNTLPTGSKPYTKKYGKGRYQKGSLSTLEIKNGVASDAIIILYNVQNGSVCRHTYIQAGETYTLQQLPEGLYDMKVYYGNDWNPSKNNGHNLPVGGFESNESYSHSTSNDYFNINHIATIDGVSYAAYSVTLYQVRNGNMQTENLTKNNFFN